MTILERIGLAATIVSSGLLVFWLFTLGAFLTLDSPVSERLERIRIVASVLTMVGVTELFLTGVW